MVNYHSLDVKTVLKNSLLCDQAKTGDVCPLRSATSFGSSFVQSILTFQALTDLRPYTASPEYDTDTRRGSA